MGGCGRLRSADCGRLRSDETGWFRWADCGEFPNVPRKSRPLWERAASPRRAAWRRCRLPVPWRAASEMPPGGWKWCRRGKLRGDPPGVRRPRGRRSRGLEPSPGTDSRLCPRHCCSGLPRRGTGSRVPVPPRRLNECCGPAPRLRGPPPAAPGRCCARSRSPPGARPPGPGSWRAGGWSPSPTWSWRFLRSPVDGDLDQAPPLWQAPARPPRCEGWRRPTGSARRDARSPRGW